MRALRYIFVTAAAAMACSACSLLQSSTSTAPSTVPPANVVVYSAVGASDVTGVGSSVPCLAFANPSCSNGTNTGGTGYAELLQTRFQSDGKTVTFQNLGIPGAVLSPEIEAIGNSLGRQIPENFVDSEQNFVLTNSTLITIFAGGNDGNTIGAAANAGLGGPDPTAYVQIEIQHYASALSAFVAGIKARAPGARIVALNLPNLAGMPYSAGDSLADKKGLQTIAVGLSAATNALQSQGVQVIDLMCDPNIYNPAIFSSDGFHPNDTGYAYLESLIYPIATGGAASTPKSSCALMNQF